MSSEPPLRAAAPLPVLAVLFVGLFGVLLASFPARNADIWTHLVAGRESVSQPSAIGSSWLYDVAAYAGYSAFGGAGLVVLKALLAGAIAILVLRMSRMHGGWRLPLAVTGLAVLAMGSRLLLQPATISVFFLTGALWLLLCEVRTPERATGVWPGWRLAVLFALWGNIDGRVVIGLALVALVWFGRLLDSPSPGGFWPAFGRRAAGLVILAAAACAGPAHVNNLQLPPELRRGIDALRADDGAATPTVNSPFSRTYLTDFRDSPAALSYFPLLALGLTSFGLNRRGWRWEWFFPWLGLAVASGIQVRLVPFFAVVAGPVTAWNLVSYFGSHGDPALVRPRTRYVIRGLTFALALAFLISAWPGWLQGPPFEPRRWVVEPPLAIQKGGDFLRDARANSLWPKDARTLHLTPDTAAAFAWFCPEDRGLRDETLVGKLLRPDQPEKAREELRALGVSRVVVYAADTGNSSREVLARLLADPDEWPVLHLTGGVVVFGWRDPARARGADLYAGWEVDFAQLAFRPDASEIAAPTRAATPRRWWDAFSKPAPAPRPMGRDEALVLLRKSEAMIDSAPQRHLTVWGAGQMGGLVGAASGWNTPAAGLDATIRSAFVNPPGALNPTPGVPLPRVTQLNFLLQQWDEYGRGHTPVGVLYASVRASRRAVAENPSDASAYYLLGQTYAALIRTTSEQSWAGRMPQLTRLRQVQASAALNRAVALNPKLAEAHLELGRLYLTLNFLDLAAVHLRAYRDSPASWGGPKKGDKRADAVLAEHDRLTEAVERQTREFARESAQSSVGDRAMMAARRGLAGEARAILLKSDVSAFGTPGMELELDLLLRTGRPEDVLEWMTPELRGSLGEFTFRFLRAQAYLALGEYAAADAEFAEITEPGDPLVPLSPVGTEVSGLVGKALLDVQPGGTSTAQIAMRTLNEFDFRARMSQTGQKLGRLADVSVLRGIIALEAGAIDRARDCFRAALTYSPNRWGGGELEFNGRWVAWACLGLIENASAKPSRPRAR